MSRFSSLPGADERAEARFGLVRDEQQCPGRREAGVGERRPTFNGTIAETGAGSYRLASARARAEKTAEAG
ncbi:hypothetical protein ACWFQ8_06725 [Streptomyces sp. NPDC055254]